ncbi:MAG: hypothetical protein JWM95_2772, partial [Gemmatimonadetes bacterium]|nr:hypothetical protein [Gemmatimonadota bacterium]
MRLTRSVTRFKAVLAASTLVFLTARCGDSGLPPTAPDTTITSLTIDPVSATLRVGETRQFTAVGTTASKTTISTGITYTSSDNNVISVNQAGLVRALLPGSATLTAKSGTAQVTAALTVTPGLAASVTKLAGDGQSAQVSTPVAISPSVVVKDSAGNVVPGATVSFTVQLGGGLLNGSAAITNAQGIASLSAWILGTVPGTNSVLATVLPSNGVVTTAFIATATPRPVAPPAVVSISDGDAQTGTVGTVLPIPLSVLVTNTDGLPAANVQVTFVVASGGGTIANATAATNTSGVASAGTWTLGATLGAQTVTATVAGLAPRTFTATATAVPLPATQLFLATAGTGAVAGVPLTTQPIVELRDLNNVLVPTATGIITANISVGGRLTGTTTATAVSGVAQFSNLIALDPGTYTITYSSPGLASASSLLRVVSGQPAVALAITTAPSGGTNTVPFAVQPVIEIRDAGGAATQGTNPVTVSVATGPGTLTGTTTVSAVNGLATFSGLGASVGGTYTLTFSSPGLASVTSVPFTVAFSSATQLAVTTQPVGGASGANLATQPVVELRDPLGSLFPGASNVVTA